MPLFEYRCKSCDKRFTALVGVIAESSQPKCPSCGSTDLSKLISRFASARSEEDMLENLADPTRYGDPEDPSSMRKLVSEMGKELGEDMGEDFEQYMEEAGQEGDDGGEDDTIY